MYLDIAIGVVALFFVLVGFWKGFMCGIVGFIASVTSLTVAIFSSKMLANIAEQNFDLTNKLDGIISGLGRPLNVLVCAAVVFIICRLIFWFINRIIRKIKRQNRVVDFTDKILGVGLGVLKAALLIGIVFIVVQMLEKIPLVGDLLKPDGWLFNGSTVGKFLYYDFFLKYIWPTLSDILAAYLPKF
jgi:uncharacterized membrane protein required for colicin V production